MMEGRHSILLGDVAERLPIIESACGRCERKGRLSTARLLAQFGPEVRMPAVLRALVGDCPKRDASQLQERCDPYSLYLARLFVTGAGE